MNVEEEVERLKEEIQRLGKVQDDGSYKMLNIFEALVGTLRAQRSGNFSHTKVSYCCKESMTMWKSYLNQPQQQQHPRQLMQLGRVRRFLHFFDYASSYISCCIVCERL
ncbi:hypothetical protein GBA52_026842 [Prunus armeniaca]|nr:hypothetical protein GBA52_026842 [Prunus armeniaca]